LANRRARATADAGKSAQAGNRLRWRVGVRRQLRASEHRRTQATACVGPPELAGNCAHWLADAGGQPLSPPRVDARATGLRSSVCRGNSADRPFREGLIDGQPAMKPSRARRRTCGHKPRFDRRPRYADRSGNPAKRASHRDPLVTQATARTSALRAPGKPGRCEVGPFVSQETAAMNARDANSGQPDRGARAPSSGDRDSGTDRGGNSAMQGVDADRLDARVTECLGVHTTHSGAGRPVLGSVDTTHSSTAQPAKRA
jgi:hypothetical protein